MCQAWAEPGLGEPDPGWAASQQFSFFSLSYAADRLDVPGVGE